MLTGALIIYFTKSKGRRVAIINWIIALLTILPVLGTFLVACPNFNIAGINTPYANRYTSSTVPSFLVAVNQKLSQMFACWQFPKFKCLKKFTKSLVCCVTEPSCEKGILVLRPHPAFRRLQYGESLGMRLYLRYCTLFLRL